jgi:hypothetical protein
MTKPANVLSPSKETWKQVKNYRGLRPPQVHGHHDLPRNREDNSIFPKIMNYYFRVKILISNDVESNPGPQIKIQSYNVRGLAEYNKLKRILNYVHNVKKSEINVWAFQETHLTKGNLLDVMWRGDYVISPGSSQARGCILLFLSHQFDTVVSKFGHDNGRLSWVVAKKENEMYMFVNLYGPNTKQDSFYQEAFGLIQEASNRHNVTSLTISGDFNVEISTKKSKGRKVSIYERKAAEMISDFIHDHGLEIISDQVNPTWYNKARSSKLDYILSNIQGEAWKSNNIWGVDNSDHAMVDVESISIAKKGPGIPRIDPSFLENEAIKFQFKARIQELISQMPTMWTPHQKLEFIKMSIRSEAF